MPACLDGDVWLAGQAGDDAGVFDPESEAFRRFALPEGAGRHNLIGDSDGVVSYGTPATVRPTSADSTP